MESVDGSGGVRRYIGRRNGIVSIIFETSLEVGHIKLVVASRDYKQQIVKLLAIAWNDEDWLC